MREVEIIGFVQTCDKSERGIRICRQPCPIDLQEGVRCRESNTLVAVNERMVLGKAFPQRRRFFDQIGVITSLGPKQSGFEQAGVTDTRCAAIPRYLVGMNGKDFRQQQIVRHSASFS